MAERGALERGHIRLALIRELASGEQTQAALAEKYGVSTAAVSQFKDRHALRIDEVRRNADQEYAGVWIAEKRNRIEELQGVVEYCHDLLGDSEKQARVNVGTAEVIRTALSALHQASEELGQLPARGLRHEGGVSVRYVIEGVDPEAYA